MAKTKEPTRKDRVEKELRAALNGKRYRVKIEGVFHEIPAGWVPSTELRIAGGWRYSARLWDLKREGRIAGYDSKPFEGSRIFIYRARLNGEGNDNA